MLLPLILPALLVGATASLILLAVSRAAALVASPPVLALLCVASLPAWLLVTGRQQMQLREDGTPVR